MALKDNGIGKAIRLAIVSSPSKRTISGTADRIGISREVLSNVINGRTIPDDDIIARLRKDLRLPPTWPEIPINKPEGRRVSLAGTPLASIRIVGHAAAGEGVTNVDIQDDQIFVPERLAQIGGLGWIVDGESMMPYLEPGDVAIFREGRQPRRGFTYLVKTPDDELRVKTIDWVGNEWMLRSMNPTFPPEPLSNHQIIGFLIGWYRAKGSRETMDSDPNGLIL